MKNHKGFTIVELLIGMTILSIVAVALTGFIVSSSKSYAASNTEIMVQQESQLAMNQISDVIIDTTRSVNYVGYSLDGSVSEQVIKDADFTIDVGDKCLVLYNGEGTVVVDADGNPVLDADGNPEIAKDADGNPIITGGNGNKNYQIYWDKSEEKLYFTEIENSETVFPESAREVLAEYVKDFSVDLSQVEEKRVVQISISYGYNNRTYETSNNITIRNKVLVNSVNLAVNKSVELNIRVKENMVVLEPGEDYYKFSTPIVDGRNVIDKSVTWSIPDEEQSKLTGADTGFTEVDNGIIHISSAEQANSFKVRVTTNAVDSAGNHAWAEVTVYVKRAKYINVYKSADSDSANGPNEISPGCTFTVRANVEGNKLDVTCSKCGDDTTIDRQVASEGNPYGNPYTWKIYKEEGWDPSQWLTMTDSDEYSATFYLSPDAPTDGSHKYVIQCMSLLSTQGNDCGRHYDHWVPGAIDLTVTKKGDLTLEGGGLKYGSRELYLKWDYQPHTAYICVRIKEDPNAPTADDKVMIYKTDGKAILIAPDVFGLDLNKDYYLSIQVLAADTDEHNNDLQTPDQVVTDYINNSKTGVYTGNLKSSSVLKESLMKPQLTIRYNGKDYTGSEVNINPIYFLSDAERSITLSIEKVSSAKGEGGEIKNGVKTNLYLGAGEDNPLYKFGTSTTGTNSRGLLKYNTDSGKIVLAMGNVDGNNIRNNNVSEINKAREAIGDYHYIPYFYYSNGTVASAFTVCYTSPNYTPNYDQQLCERPESKINFSITDKGNLSLWAYTSKSEFKYGEILFPLPSDSSFRDYFSLNNPELQSVVPTSSFIMNDKDGDIQSVAFSRITCKYISTEDKYEIELFYECMDTLRNSKIEMLAGRFKCSTKGTTWEIKDVGTLDEQLKNGNTTVIGNGNAYIKIGGEYSYSAYIALPYEDRFTNWWNGNYGFELEKIKQGNGKEVDAGCINEGQPVYISYVTKDDKGVPCVKSVPCIKATCYYDENTKTFTLKLKYKDSSWNNVYEGTYTYTEGKTSWELKNP